MNQHKPLKSHHSNTAKHNTQSETVSQRVVRQLVEALLFEQLVDYHYSKGCFYFNLRHHAFKAQGRIAAFNRVRLDGANIFYLKQAKWEAPEPLFIVEHLPAQTVIKQRLAEEIQQTLDLCLWNTENLAPIESRRQLPYHKLESAIHEGHPYHPCFKARTGFDIADHIAYGPECANKIKLHWFAIQREFIHLQLSDTENLNTAQQHAHFWQNELDSAAWQLIEQRLALQGASWQNYRLLPAHPWQAKKLLPELQTAIQAKQIIDLGIAGDEYQASISVRTLINISRPEKANIKLPLSMVNTSSLRTIEAHSIRSAPVLSQWLEQVIDNDSFFEKDTPLTVLPEYAGIRLYAPATEPATHWASLMQDKLGVIFRESLSCSHPDSTVVPFVALSLFERDKYPFIHYWLEQYGCEPWLEQLLQTTVIPIWHLLIHHGIAVEAHAQNMLLLRNNGWPQKIILRDFHESLEFVYDFLPDPAAAPDFTKLDDCYQSAEPDQYYWMQDCEALRELFADTLFVFNLTELSTLMENVYGYSEKLFWQKVYQQLERYKTKLHTSLQRHRDIDLHEDTIQAEALLKRKLSSKKSQEFHHRIANAIAHEAFSNKKLNHNIETTNSAARQLKEKA